MVLDSGLSSLMKGSSSYHNLWIIAWGYRSVKWPQGDCVAAMWAALCHRQVVTHLLMMQFADRCFSCCRQNLGSVGILQWQMQSMSNLDNTAWSKPGVLRHPTLLNQIKNAIKNAAGRTAWGIHFWTLWNCRHQDSNLFGNKGSRARMSLAKVTNENCESSCLLHPCNDDGVTGNVPLSRLISWLPIC